VKILEKSFSVNIVVAIGFKELKVRKGKESYKPPSETVGGKPIQRLPRAV